MKDLNYYIYSSRVIWPLDLFRSLLQRPFYALSTKGLQKGLKLKYNNFTFVLCGCETQSPAIRERHRLRLFEEKCTEDNIGT
jgi:hypothetical protein